MQWDGLTAAARGDSLAEGQKKTGKRKRKEYEKYYSEWEEDQRRPYTPSPAGLPDARFVLLNKQQIRDNAKMMTDPTVAIAWHMIDAGCFGAGIVLHQHDEKTGKLIPGSSDGIGLTDTLEDKWFQSTYLQFCKDATRIEWVTGFKPIARVRDQHMTDRLKPVILNLDKVDVLYSRNVFNEHMWVFIYQNDARDTFALSSKNGNSHFIDRFLGYNNGTGMFGGQIIDDVWVKCENAPDATDGSIQSVLSIISARRHYLNLLLQFNLKACAKNSNHEVLTESLVGRRNGEIQPDTNRFSDGSGAVGVMSQNGRATDRSALEQRAGDMADRMLYELAVTQKAFGGDKVHAAIRDHVFTAAMGELLKQAATFVHLPDGRKAVTMPSAEQPSELVAQQVLQQQEILMLLGLPPSTIQPESTRGRMTENNGMEIFNSTLRALKQKLVADSEAAYHLVNDESIIDRTIKDTPLTEKLTAEKLKQRLKINISFPGVPPAEKLRELYVDGLLKYEAYVELISQIYVMDRAHFNEKPALELLDVLSGGNRTLAKDQIKADEKSEKADIKLREKEIAGDLQIKKQKAKDDTAIKKQTAKDAMVIKKQQAKDSSKLKAQQAKAKPKKK